MKNDAHDYKAALAAVRIADNTASWPDFGKAIMHNGAQTTVRAIISALRIADKLMHPDKETFDRLAKSFHPNMEGQSVEYLWPKLLAALEFIKEVNDEQ